jgi:hypothetical protein
MKESESTHWYNKRKEESGKEGIRKALLYRRLPTKNVENHHFLTTDNNNQFGQLSFVKAETTE